MSNISDSFKNLFLKLVSYNPSERPTIDEIYEHPWMNDSKYDKEKTKINLITKFISKTQPCEPDAIQEEEQKILKNDEYSI